MKDQPYNLNQTWPVGRKWCRFTNTPNKFFGPPQIWGAKTSNFYHISVTWALDTSYLRNKTTHRQTKMLVSMYNVSPKIDLLSVTLDPETADVHLLIVTHPSAAITLQPS